MRPVQSSVTAAVMAMLMFLSGCSATLVHDDVKRTASLDGHCAGAEWADASSIAVIPVPVVAFIVPHVDLHQVAGEPYLSRCGDSTRVVNRDVTVDKTACIPAGLTRIITLGVWQWCPARIAWSADVLADPVKPAVLQEERAKPQSQSTGTQKEREL